MLKWSRVLTLSRQVLDPKHCIGQKGVKVQSTIGGKSAFFSPLDLNKQLTLEAQARPHCKGEYSEILEVDFIINKKNIEKNEYFADISSLIFLHDGSAAKTW